MSHAVQVRVQGRDYTLRSEQSPEQIQRVARFVEEQLAAVGASGSVDTQDRTVLALLNLAGQFLLLQERVELESHQQDSLRVLVGRLEESLNDS